MARARSGGSAGSERSFVPVSPSLLSQIRLETPQGKRAGHLPDCGEPIPEMNVFPSTEAGCPPPAPVCQPQQPPRLPHLLDAERGFPQRAPTWSEPHFPEARRDIFKGIPPASHSLSHLPGARPPREAEETAGSPAPLTAATSPGPGASGGAAS